MLKILHFSNEWLSGTKTWLYNVITAHDDDRVRFAAFAEHIHNLKQFPFENLYSYKDPYPYLLFRALRKFEIKATALSLKRAILAEEPQILHSHFGPFGYYNAKLANKMGLKHVITFYGVDVNKVPQKRGWKRRYQKMFQRADLFLCEGAYMAQELINQGCPREKVKVQRLGIEVDKIEFEPRKIPTPGEGTIRFLFASTFRPKKGIPYGIEAIGKLQDKLQDFEIVLIGDSTGAPDEEEEKMAIEAVIQQYNLASRVKRLGFVTQETLWQEAKKAHFFMAPSRTAPDGDTEGGAPVVIMEMAASGLPVVATTHCDIPNILGSEYQKYLSTPEDSDQIAEVVWHLVQGDTESLLKSTRSFIEQYHDLKVTNGALLSLYRSLV